MLVLYRYPDGYLSDLLPRSIDNELGNIFDCSLFILEYNNQQ